MTHFRAVSLAVLVSMVSIQSAGAQFPPRVPIPTTNPGAEEVHHHQVNRCRDPQSDTARRIDSTYTQHRQLACNRGFGIGLQAGAADMTIPGGVPAGFTAQTGFVVGAYVNRPLVGSLSFVPGIEYMNTRAQSTGIGPLTNITFNYFEAPLLARLSNEHGGRGVPPDGETFGLFIEAGPEINLSLSCSSVATYDAVAASTCSGRTGVSSIDYGAIGDVGFDVLAFRQMFTVLARYDDGGVSAAPGLGFRTRGLSLMLGVRW